MAYQINRKVTATSKITPDSTSSCLILVLTQKSNYLLRSSPETFFYLTLTRIILIKALINACGKFSNMLIHVSLHSIQIFIAHVFAHSNVKVVKLIYYLKMLYKWNMLILTGISHLIKNSTNSFKFPFWQKC